MDNFDGPTTDVIFTETYIPTFDNIAVSQMSVSGTNLSTQNLQQLQHIDINTSLVGLLNTKQNNITTDTDIHLNSINSVSSNQLNYLTNINSDIQTQINSKQNTINSNTDINLNSINNVSSNQLNYLTNINSDIQTQINNKTDLTTVQSNDNHFTGNVNFSNIPTYNTDSLINKAYVDNINTTLTTNINTKTTLNGVQNNNNVFTGNNKFNNLPTYSSNDSLINKAYVDNNFMNTSSAQSISGVKTYNNIVISGVGNFTDNGSMTIGDASNDSCIMNATCYFNSPIIASNVSIPVDNISNLQYLNVSGNIQASLDSKAGLSSNNSYTGHNDFSSYCPTSYIT